MGESVFGFSYGDEEFSVVTKSKRNLNEIVGNRIWLVGGEGKSPKEYYLCYYFIADKFDKLSDDPVFKYEVSGKRGKGFQPILLNDFLWFQKFYVKKQTYGQGIQTIPNKLATKFEHLAETAGPVKALPLAEEWTNIRKKMNGKSPEIVKRTVEKWIRHDDSIVQHFKQAADYKCQFPDCNVRIQKKDGGFYIEVAHIMPVAKGGKGEIGNLLVLCPNHHKEFDYGERDYKRGWDFLVGVLNGKKFNIKLLGA